MTVVWSHDIGDAMSPRTNLHVAGHMVVRLPATPPPHGALDDEELFNVDGSKNPRTRDSTPLGGVRKKAQNAPKKHPFRLEIVIGHCR